MKPSILASLLILALATGSAAQGLQTLTGSTLVGTANGALLGLGTMALTNSSNTGPVRVGIGMGTLYGLGVGVYDVSSREIGSGYRVEGLFNSANYSTMIVLLDTFYGGVTGAIVGTALQLMADKPLVDGLQYGMGVGLWGGFVFGLADVFFLNDPIPTYGSLPLQVAPTERVAIAFIQPAMIAAPVWENGNATIRWEPTVDVARVTIRF